MEEGSFMTKIYVSLLLVLFKFLYQVFFVINNLILVGLFLLKYSK